MPFNSSLKILVLGLNYSPEMVGIAVYTTGLAEALVGRGHEVHVVAGKPYYPTWSVSEEYRGGGWRSSYESGVAITRVPHYVPSVPTGFKRLLHHATFALSSLWPALLEARRWKPDAVIAVAPSLIAAPVAQLAAKVSGAKSWLHIQDFEAEAAIATGLIGGDGLAARTARGFERAVISLFDHVSSISPAMCRKLIEKGIPATRISEFRNWADVAAITPLTATSSYRSEWNIGDRQVALYSGNIANKQGIDIIVDAAMRLEYRKDLVFVVCGQGSYRHTLESRAGDLKNIIFKDLQPRLRLRDLLGLASMHLLPQLSGAADLVLPSKLTNMLASGRPVVATASPGTDLANEVLGCGLVIPPNDEVAFAAAIEQLLDDDIARTAFGVAARMRAEERWEQNAIVGDFEEKLITLTHKVVKAESVAK